MMLMFQNGALLCGGDDDFFSPHVHYSDDCVRLSLDTGVWHKSNQLNKRRWRHTSWETKDGVLIIGGGHSANTTELVKNYGRTLEHFNLRYPSK